MRTMRFRIWAFAAAFAVISGLARGEEPDAFDDAITVSIAPIVLRAVDNLGRPIPGLSPEDFRVRVGRSEVPVLAVDWYEEAVTDPAPPGEAAPTGVEAPAGGLAGADFPTSQGQLYLVFVQASLEPAQALHHLARTTAGYYVLTLDTGELPARGGALTVELRGRKGDVLMAPRAVPARGE